MTTTHASSPAGGLGIELKGVSKVYPKSVALRHVDLEVNPGEFMVFLGPSGSGKTTTLNVIAGFETPTTGEVLVDAQDITPVPVHQRDLGVVFQHYALFPHLTVGENVAFPLKRRQHKVPKDERTSRVAEVLEMVGLGDHADRYPRELSGGQQQRVALARALVYNPRAMLLDEPFGALDKNLRETLQLELRRIHEELGTTFLFVTHDQDEAMVLADRIAIFRDGQIEQVGTPRELYADPASLFVAEFMGESTLVEGDLTAEGGAYTLKTPAGVIHGQGAFESGRYASVIRPENVWFAGADEPQEAHVTALSATVDKLIYLGSATRVEAILDGGIKAVARLQDVGTLTPGQRVQTCWRTEQASVLPVV